MLLKGNCYANIMASLRVSDVSDKADISESDSDDSNENEQQVEKEGEGV